MFDQLRENLSEYLGTISTMKMIMISVVLVVFVGITYYVYQHYVQPRLNPDFVAKEETGVADVEPTGPAKVVYYFVKWCPHCKKATPEWNTAKEELNGKEINGTEVIFEEVDCEKNAENKERADKNKITCYPTIKLYKPDDTIVEYNAKPEAATLKEFLNMTI